MRKVDNKRPNWALNFGLIAGLFVVGLLSVLLMIGSFSSAAANNNGTEAVSGGWSTEFAETFESDISASWTITDVNGATTGGEYYWATTTYTASENVTSVWATGGGADGSTLVPGTDDYPNSALTSMIHTPVDLSGTVGARLSFDYWLDTEDGVDVVQVRASTDGTNFDVLSTLSGNSNGWQTTVLTLTDYVDSPEVWLGFWFSSNTSNTGLGVFVDNVVLESLVLQKAYFPLVRFDPTPTPSPTPTPLPYYYFDDFSDSGSGWPVVNHTSDKTDCFKWFYENGVYKVDICDDRTDVKTSPLVQLPGGDYTIDVDAKFRYSGGWWNAYGIIFDGKDDPDPDNPDLGDYYMLWVLWEGDSRFKWKILKDVPGKQVDVTEWKNLDSSYFNYGPDGLEWNHWKIVRTSSTISIYVNGYHLKTVTESRPTTNYQVLFGLYASTYETNLAKAGFDNFKVTVNNGTTALPALGEPFFSSSELELEEFLPQENE